MDNKERIAAKKQKRKDAKHTISLANGTDDIRKFASIDLGASNYSTKYQLAKLSAKHKKYTNQHPRHRRGGGVWMNRETHISNYLHTASRQVITYLQQFRD